MNSEQFLVIGLIAFIVWIIKIADEPRDPRPLHRGVKVAALLIAAVAVNAYFFGWFMRLIVQHPIGAALFIIAAVIGFAFPGPGQ